MQAPARGRWPKGRSGNPAGKPRGARHKSTLAAEALLDGQAEALSRKAVELALAGDTVALRLCLERILPARRERPIQLALLPLDGVAGLAATSAALLDAVAAGEVTPGEAGELARLLEAHRKLVETVELEARLARLEAQAEAGRR
jgi:hypothetical protein